MSEFSRRSSSLVALLGVVVGAGCVEHETSERTTTSLRVAVTAPADLGTPDRRLADGLAQVGIAVTALDDTGRTDSRFNGSVDVYIQTLNALSEQPARVTLTGGAGAGNVALPPVVFGATYLWVEDVTGDPRRIPTYATGTSPTLWFREPVLADVSTPDLTGTPSSWLRRSPLEGKQVRISTSEHGAAGKLVVTGVYADGFSVSDVSCTSRPCRAEPFAHIYVFSFSRPIDVMRRPVQIGQVLKAFEGGVAEFNGFTELNFPVQELVDARIDETLLPDPVAIDPAWLASGNDQGLLRLEEQESGLVSVAGVKVCPLDNDFERFQQWKVDIGRGCGTPVNEISASTVASFDPAAMVGRRLTRIVGALRAVNLGSFNVWILLPRRAADITQ
jgi:hypothetical protein